MNQRRNPIHRLTRAIAAAKCEPIKGWKLERSRVSPRQAADSGRRSPVATGTARGYVYTSTATIISSRVARQLSRGFSVARSKVDLAKTRCAKVATKYTLPVASTPLPDRVCDGVTRVGTHRTDTYLLTEMDSTSTGRRYLEE